MVLFSVLGTLGVGCVKASIATDCPPTEVVAALHAAAFYFQHESLEEGRLRLEEAKKRLPPKWDDAVTRGLLAQLSRTAVLDGRDERSRQAEEVRVVLSPWACLPNALHDSLHRELPEITGLR